MPFATVWLTGKPPPCTGVGAYQVELDGEDHAVRIVRCGEPGRAAILRVVRGGAGPPFAFDVADGSHAGPDANRVFFEFG